MSWMYYFMWSVFLAAGEREQTSISQSRIFANCFTDWNNAAVILQYWVPTTTVPIWAWYLIFWALFSTITTLGVGFYGEIEYFFGMFKFIALAVLFFISILSNVGAFGNGYVGFRYWGEPYGLSISKWLVSTVR